MSDLPGVGREEDIMDAREESEIAIQWICCFHLVRALDD